MSEAVVVHKAGAEVGMVLAPSPEEWLSMKDQAGVTVRGGLLPKGIDTLEKALTVMLVTREMRIPMMAGLQNAYIVHGRVQFKTELLLMLAYERIPGFTYEVLELSRSVCTVRVSRAGQGKTTITFNEEMAKRSDVLKNSVWGTWSEDMYKWAATRKALRAVGAGMGWILSAMPDDEEGVEPEAKKELPASSATVVGAEAALVEALGGPQPAPTPKQAPLRYDVLTKEVGDRIRGAKITARGVKETFTSFVNAMCEWGELFNGQRFASYQHITSDEWKLIHETALRYEEWKAAGGAESPKAAGSTDATPVAQTKPEVQRFEAPPEPEPEKDGSAGDMLSAEALVERCQQAERVYKQHKQTRQFIQPGGGTVWFIDMNILETCGLAEAQDVFDLGESVVGLLRRGVEQAMVDLDARKGRPKA